MATVARMAALEEAIVQRIGSARYKQWFVGHTNFKVEADQLIVGVPNLYYQEWMSKTFLADVQEVARDILGESITVKFRIDPQLFRAGREEQEAVEKEQRAAQPHKTENATDEGTKPTADTGQKPRGAAETKSPRLFDDEPPSRETRQHPAGQRPAKPRRTWRNLADFVVGKSNRVVFAAAQSVVEEPGQGANPLVIHGPVGTGKTHLLEGIYLGLRKQWPEFRTIFISAEDFTNRFIQSMRHGKLSNFRRQFRECDALLLDNLQFLAKKTRTVEEFLHTFDALQADGKQVVVTSDCHPRLTEDFPPEVIDRLLGGAVWGLQPPDPATRLELLRAKSARGGPPIIDKVLTFLTGQLRGNVRELEGAVVSLRHYAKVSGKPIDIALAREALGDLLRHAIRVIQLEDIDLAVCKVLRLAPGSLQSKSRSWTVSHPRMLAIYLARKHTKASYSEIGKHFGGRNHSTAVAAEKKVRQWLTAGEKLTTTDDKPWAVRELLELIERQLGL